MAKWILSKMEKNEAKKAEPETISVRDLKDKIPSGANIFFNDPHTRRKPDRSGFNQYGIFLRNGNVLFNRPRWYGRKGKMFELPPAMLGKEIKVACSQDISFRSKFCIYFEMNRDNYRLFDLGISKLTSNEFSFFDYPEIMPNWKEKQFDDNKEKWERLYSVIKPGDLFTAFDPQSLVSRLIAWVDDGSWSHCGLCLGGSQVSEVTSKGRIISDLEDYRKKRVHVGVYRQWPELNEDQTARLIHFSLSKLGGKYNYIGAFKCGVNTLLGRDNWVNKRGDRFIAPTPNGMIYSGHFRLIEYI
jgi:hypothetical protein